MKIRKIKIKNFRGIKELEWNLPKGNIFCLIGKGDSCKSTILDSIQYAFYPQWNLSLSDSDFYKSNIHNPIIIEVCIGELAEEFCSLKKYGSFLQGWDAENLIISDEPGDGLENVMVIRMTITKDLEPKWIVTCPSNPEGVDFKTSDRSKVSVGLIGAYAERQFSWANGTAITKLTNTQNLNESLADASRTARSALDVNRIETLKNFDDAALRSQEVAKILGVPVLEGYKAHLDLNAINIKIGALALHDAEIPLRQLGLGSRRMLLCGIQKECLENNHITLFDELEFGLEPHRIARLIKHIKADDGGQYFLTTHSPTVVRELTAKDLYVVHNKSGIVQILAASDKRLEGYEIQGKLRSSADAFLAQKIVVCEGATEVGFLRGFDDYQLSEGREPFSYHGVALLDATGANNIKGVAEAFRSLCYTVSVLADGDAPDNFSDIDEENLAKIGVYVQVWSEKLSLEERAMMDLPWQNVLDSVKLANNELGITSYEHVQSALNEVLDRNIDKWQETKKLRDAIGKAAKKGQWFKNVTRGDLWFKKISPAFKDINFLKTDLAVKLSKVWEWAEHV